VCCDLLALPSVPTRRSSDLLAFGVLEKACVDLAERDGQRLLARTRLDERADVLEQALTEPRVVVVDLARTLGRVDHERVLRADLVAQVVDGRVGDALELLALRAQRERGHYCSESAKASVSGISRKSMGTGRHPGSVRGAGRTVDQV